MKRKTCTDPRLREWLKSVALSLPPECMKASNADTYAVERVVKPIANGDDLRAVVKVRFLVSKTGFREVGVRQIANPALPDVKPREFHKELSEA